MTLLSTHVSFLGFCAICCTLSGGVYRRTSAICRVMQCLESEAWLLSLAPIGQTACHNLFQTAEEYVVVNALCPGAQVMSDERDSKVRQVLERLSLPLQHRLRRAQVPTALRETLAVVHASPAELDALLNGGGGGVEEVAPPDGGEGSMIAGVEDLPVSPALRKLFCNSGRSPTAAEAGWATLCKQLNKMQAVFTSRLDTLGKSGDSAVGETRQQTQVLVSQLLEGQLEVVTSCLSQERSSNSFCCQQGSRKVK